MLQGVVGSTAGGFAGVSAFAAACGLGIRALPAFGVWTVAPRWLLIAAGMGAAGYGLIFIIQLAHAAPFSIRNPRDIKDEAARGGVLPFFLSLLGGAGFSPFGEDILFRGTVANALNRYAAWAGIDVSSKIFRLAPGVSMIPLVAVGLLAATLFHRTGSS